MTEDRDQSSARGQQAAETQSSPVKKEGPTSPGQKPQEDLNALLKQKDDKTNELQDVVAKIDVLKPMVNEISPLVNEYRKFLTSALGDQASLQKYLDTSSKLLETNISKPKQDQVKSVRANFKTTVEDPLTAARDKAREDYPKAVESSKNKQQKYDDLKGKKQALDDKIKKAKALKEKIESESGTQNPPARAYFFLLELRDVMDDINKLSQKTPEDLEKELNTASKNLFDEKDKLRKAELAKNKAEKEYNDMPKREQWILTEIEKPADSAESFDV